MNPVIKLIRDTLTAQGWTWWGTGRSPSHNDVQETLAELVETMDNSDQISTGGILLMKDNDLRSEIEVYVQVGIYRDGEFLPVPGIQNV